MEQAVQDIRFGVRSLARSPGFAASAILSLALGIGATTAIFSVIHGMTIRLSDKRYPTREARNNFYLQLLERAQQVPGLTDIALNQSVHPFIYFGTYANVPGSRMRAKTQVIVSEISAEYPNLVDTSLTQGRLITATDVRGARRVAVVNSKFASFFFPKRDLLGQNVKLLQLHPPPDPAPNETCEIVGLVSDLPNIGLKRETAPEVYVPFTIAGYAELSATLLAKGAVALRRLIKPLESQIHAIDPDQPVMEIRTLREWLDLRGYSEPRFGVFLFGVFASLGLLLAELGIYAIVNYSVLRQTPEIAVRMALGAQGSGIVRMVAGSGAKLLDFGAVLGMIGSLSVAHVLWSMIWGVSPFDPLSFAAVILVLFGIGLLACMRPAWRAAQVHPMTALRYE